MRKMSHQLFVCTVVVLWVLPAARATGQEPGSIAGRVTREIDGTAVSGVRVQIEGTTISTVTGPDGRYGLARVPAGNHVVLFRWLGYQPQQATVTVRSGSTATVDVVLAAQVISLGEIIVEGASRTPERVVEAPAAVTVISPVTLRNKSLTGQAPTALEDVPGVELVQSGVNDFNVNARGFNSSLNRRVLVMQDGRDLAIAFLGSQEWNSMTVPLEDIHRLEMVRGPGSALYGANAFSGVVNIQTPTARDVIGTKMSLGGGELSTLRGDLRHAGISTSGRWGYRLNAGYYRSDSWTESRTALDGSDAEAEYQPVADEPVTTGVPSCAGLENCLSIEAIPLAGQSRNATTGVATGNPDDLQNVYGSGRLDYYLDNGSIFTAEGGGAQVENEVFVTGIGRVQVPKALRPWARVAYDADRYNLMAWYSGRNSIDPQVSLTSGAPLEESSAIFHVEGQFNRPFAEDRGRVVVGASYRNYNVDTDGTLMMPADDDRSDDYYSGYGQVEFRVVPQLRLVAAARVDDGTLFETQFSPKGGVVYTPHPDHSVRATVNRAFQTPNYSEFFLRAAAGSPTSGPDQLETGLETYFATVQNPTVVGPQLAAAMAQLGLPADIPWNFNQDPAETELTPILALGNADLEVETVTGWEVGYKGNISDRAYVTFDVYYNSLSNFVTDLLPGVNQNQYPTFSLDSGGVDVMSDLAAIDAILAGAGLPPEHPLRANNAALLAGYQNLAASPVNSPALTTVNGQRAIVVSYANAGSVDEWGAEFGVGFGITPELRIDASYTLFDFDVDETSVAQGDRLLPNSAKHKGGVSLTYTGQQGVDAGVSTRFIDSYEWAAGIFAGTIPSRQDVDLNVGYRFNNYIRVHALVTNLLDQDRFQQWGGSVIGRRILGGVTATF